MEVLPLRRDLALYLESHQITRQYEKQKRLFAHNPFHRSLETEVLEPKHLRIYSFRVTRKYRAIFIYLENTVIEVIDINNHYR